jgi:hypothetical protein
MWVVLRLIEGTAEIELALNMRNDITRMKPRRPGQGEGVAAPRVKQGIVTSISG